MPRAILYLLALIVATWMLCQLVHEAGHVLGTWYGGGRVVRVVWHPLTVSRTDRELVAAPMVAEAGGVVVGALVPFVLWLALCWTRVGREARFFAGFCLVTNGVYLLAGVPFRFGDAAELRGLGVPLWVLLGSGFATATIGLWLWWDLRGLLGLRRDRRPSWRRTLVLTAGAAIILVIACLVGGPV